MSMSGDEYLLVMTQFLCALERDLAGSSILTLSLSLTSVTTTLSQQQVQL